MSAVSRVSARARAPARGRRSRGRPRGRCSERAARAAARAAASRQRRPAQAGVQHDAGGVDDRREPVRDRRGASDRAGQDLVARGAARRPCRPPSAPRRGSRRASASAGPARSVAAARRPGPERRSASSEGTSSRVGRVSARPSACPQPTRARGWAGSAAPRRIGRDGRHRGAPGVPASEVTSDGPRRRPRRRGRAARATSPPRR